MPQVQALLKSWVVISMLVIFLVTSETTKCLGTYWSVGSSVPLQKEFSERQSNR